jgi:hypothetical protein
VSSLSWDKEKQSHISRGATEDQGGEGIIAGLDLLLELGVGRGGTQLSSFQTSHRDLRSTMENILRGVTWWKF